jgi:GTP cyclohydrolase I
MDNVVKSLSVERALGPSADKFLITHPTQEQAEEAVRTLILWAGDDPSR